LQIFIIERITLGNNNSKCLGRYHLSQILTNNLTKNNKTIAILIKTLMSSKKMIIIWEVMKILWEKLNLKGFRWLVITITKLTNNSMRNNMNKLTILTLTKLLFILKTSPNFYSLNNYHSDIWDHLKFQVLLIETMLIIMKTTSVTITLTIKQAAICDSIINYKPIIKTLLLYILKICTLCIYS